MRFALFLCFGDAGLDSIAQDIALKPCKDCEHPGKRTTARRCSFFKHYGIFRGFSQKHPSWNDGHALPLTARICQQKSIFMRGW
jgi:hypothetical protein